MTAPVEGPTPEGTDPQIPAASPEDSAVTAPAAEAPAAEAPAAEATDGEKA